MIRPASRADLSPIRELLAAANELPYDLSRVAAEKCFGAGYEGTPEVRVAGDFDGISVTCGRFLRLLAVRPELRGKGIGSELLGDAGRRGASVIAAEPGNYFTPGVPESMVPFFAARGYGETGRTNTLECPTQTSGESFAVSTAQDDRGRKRVLEFVAKEFSPIWRFEAERGAKLLYIECDGQIAGFSTYEANNRGLGSFGPTGVAGRFRRRGFGERLLLASLADLQRLGYHRAVIPWTDAIEFYRKSCGARVANRFVILQKK